MPKKCKAPTLFVRSYLPVISVVGDVFVDSKAPVLTSSISSRGLFVGLVFEGAHRGRVCMYVYKDECACVVNVCSVIFKKNVHGPLPHSGLWQIKRAWATNRFSSQT